MKWINALALEIQFQMILYPYHYDCYISKNSLRCWIRQRFSFGFSLENSKHLSNSQRIWKEVSFVEKALGLNFQLHGDAQLGLKGPIAIPGLVNKHCPSNFGRRFEWCAVSIADGDFKKPFNIALPFQIQWRSKLCFSARCAFEHLVRFRSSYFSCSFGLTILLFSGIKHDRNVIIP